LPGDCAMQWMSALLVVLITTASLGCNRTPSDRVGDAAEPRPMASTEPPPAEDSGERAVPDLLLSLRRLSRVDETAPFIPFVTPRSRAWLAGQPIEVLRAMLSGELSRLDCREGRCIAWMKDPKNPARPLVFLQRPVAWLWDPGASLSYQDPDPGPPDPENRDRKPEEVFRSFPGSGSLEALLETDAGTLRCVLEERDVPASVSLFVGLATGLRAHREPSSGEWVHRPCFGRQDLSIDQNNRALVLACPEGNEDIGPGFWKPDELRMSLRMDRPGRLAFDPPGPNRVGGRVVLTLAPDPDRDGLATVLGQCGPEETLRHMASMVSASRGRDSPAIRLKGITVVREEKATR